MPYNFALRAAAASHVSASDRSGRMRCCAPIRTDLSVLLPGTVVEASRCRNSDEADKVLQVPQA